MNSAHIFMIVQLVCLGGLLYTTTKFPHQRSTHLHANNGSSTSANFPLIPHPSPACVFPPADTTPDADLSCGDGTYLIGTKYNSYVGGTTTNASEGFFLTNDFNVIVAVDKKGNRCTDGLLVGCDVVIKSEAPCDDLWEGRITTRKNQTKTANTKRCKSVRAINWVNWGIVVFCLIMYGISSFLVAGKVTGRVGTETQTSLFYKVMLGAVYLSVLVLFCLTIYSYSATRDKNYLDEIVGADAFPKSGKNEIKSQIDGPNALFAFQLIFSLVPVLGFIYIFVMGDGWKSEAFNPTSIMYSMADVM